MPDRSNVIDLASRRRPAQPEVIHTSSLRRSDLPWVLVFDIGPYQIPLFVGLPGDDPPSAA